MYLLYYTLLLMSILFCKKYIKKYIGGNQAMDIKKVFIDICYQNGISRRHILECYNKKYNKEIQEASFNRMINNNNIKYNMLCNVLDSIGYSIDIIKKL